MVSFSNSSSCSFDFSFFFIQNYFHCLRSSRDVLTFAWFDNRSIGLHMLCWKLQVSCILQHYMLGSLCQWDRQLVFLPGIDHTKHQASERVCWSDASHKGHQGSCRVTWQLVLSSASQLDLWNLSTAVPVTWFSRSIDQSNHVKIWLSRPSHAPSVLLGT